MGSWIGNCCWKLNPWAILLLKHITASYVKDFIKVKLYNPYILLNFSILIFCFITIQAFTTLNVKGSFGSCSFDCSLKIPSITILIILPFVSEWFSLVHIVTVHYAIFWVLSSFIIHIFNYLLVKTNTSLRCVLCMLIQVTRHYFSTNPKGVDLKLYCGCSYDAQLSFDRGKCLYKWLRHRKKVMLSWLFFFSRIRTCP